MIKFFTAPRPSKVRRETCKRKKRYRTRLKALGAAARATDRGRPMRYYKCEFCSGFHLTKDREAINGSNTGSHRPRSQDV